MAWMIDESFCLNCITYLYQIWSHAPHMQMPTQGLTSLFSSLLTAYYPKTLIISLLLRANRVNIDKAFTFDWCLKRAHLSKCWLLTCHDNRHASSSHLLFYQAVKLIAPAGCLCNIVYNYSTMLGTTCAVIPCIWTPATFRYENNLIEIQVIRAWNICAQVL